jgi:hypothetical protein
MSADVLSYFYFLTRLLVMAATTKNKSATDKVKRSEVPVPWCAEFEAMISGCK